MPWLNRLDPVISTTQCLRVCLCLVKQTPAQFLDLGMRYGLGTFGIDAVIWVRGADHALAEKQE